MARVRVAGREINCDLVEPLGTLERTPPLVVRLSLVVSVTDGFTQGAPLGAIDMWLQPGGRRPVFNASGKPCFLDVPAGSYTLLVRSEFYVDSTTPVTLPLADPLQPVVVVELAPLPSYPFAAGSTLLRGVVQDAATNRPIANANVRIVESTPQTRTTVGGEFVLGWSPLKGDQVVTQRVGGVVKRYVRNAGIAREMTVEVTSRGFQARTVVLAQVEEGSVVSLGKINLTAI